MKNLYNAGTHILYGKLTASTTLIIVRLNGSLGNQLFQYVMGRYLCEI